MTTPTKLSHYNDAGEARMVDVSDKKLTRREAVAEAFVELNAEVLAALPQNPRATRSKWRASPASPPPKKQRTSFPCATRCRSRSLTWKPRSCTPPPCSTRAEASASAHCRPVAGTGVEMEAMTAAAVAALTVYDMTKALDKSIRIREVVLLSKKGGKSGDYHRAASEP